MAKIKINPAAMLFHTLKNDIHKLEYDPAIQLRINIVMLRFWCLNFAVALCCYILANPFWQKVSVLYLVLVSIYANAVGHYSGIPGSYAAVRADEIKKAQQNPSHQDLLDEIKTSEISTDKIAANPQNVQIISSSPKTDLKPLNVADNKEFAV